VFAFVCVTCAPMCLCVFVSVGLHAQLHVGVHECTAMCVCACLSVGRHVRTGMHMHIHISIYLYNIYIPSCAFSIARPTFCEVP